jgi:hypothetical protein
MTLRSKHLAALDSTVAGDSDVKLIFGDSTMQASLLGTARKNLAFFQPSSHLVRNVRIVPRNMVQDLRGVRLCVVLAECRARRVQNLLPSRRLATRARVSRRNKQKPRSSSIRYARRSASALSLLRLPGTGPLATVPAHQCQSSSRVTTIRASSATQRDGARSNAPPTSFLHLQCP